VTCYAAELYTFIHYIYIYMTALITCSISYIYSTHGNEKSLSVYAAAIVTETL